MSLIQKESVED